MKKKFLMVAVASLVFLLSGSGRADHVWGMKGFPPLQDAILHDDFATAKRLIQNGADVNAKAKYGRTALYGRTPLFYAAWTNAHKVAALLIEKGADVNAKAKYGWTPLHLAARTNAYEVAVLLIKKGADVNAGGSDNGWTPLHLAARINAYEVAVLLIKKGANVNAKTDGGETPLDFAREKEYTKTIALLEAPIYGYCHVGIKVQPDQIARGVDTVVAFSQVGEFDSDLEAAHLLKMRNIIKSKYKTIFVKRGTEECKFIGAESRANQAYSKALTTQDAANIHLIFVNLL